MLLSGHLAREKFMVSDCETPSATFFLFREGKIGTENRKILLRKADKRGVFHFCQRKAVDSLACHSWLIPRIEGGRTGRLKVPDVASDDRETIGQRRRRDQ
jgi:hypothetical protein